MLGAVLKIRVPTFREFCLAKMGDRRVEMKAEKRDETYHRYEILIRD